MGGLAQAAPSDLTPEDLSGYLGTDRRAVLTDRRAATDALTVKGASLERRNLIAPAGRGQVEALLSLPPEIGQPSNDGSYKTLPYTGQTAGESAERLVPARFADASPTRKDAVGWSAKALPLPLSLTILMLSVLTLILRHTGPALARQEIMRRS